MRHILTLAALLLAAVAIGQVTSTRTTAFDWQCEGDATNYQRFDTAFAACVSATLKDGKPRLVKGGTYRISVTGSAPVPPPSPTPGSATISWTPPVKNSDGSALTDLAGYYIDYGLAPNALNQTVKVDGPGIASYIVTGLTPGTWYFSVEAYTSGTPSITSERSTLASKVIQ